MRSEYHTDSTSRGEYRAILDKLAQKNDEQGHSIMIGKEIWQIELGAAQREVRHLYRERYLELLTI